MSALGRYELLDSTCLPLRHAIITCTLRSASTDLQYQAEQHPFAWQPEEGSCFAWCGGYCCILCIAVGRVLGDDAIATKIWIEQVGSKWRLAQPRLYNRMACKEHDTARQGWICVFALQSPGQGLVQLSCYSALRKAPRVHAILTRADALPSQVQAVVNKYQPTFQAYGAGIALSGEAQQRTNQRRRIRNASPSQSRNQDSSAHAILWFC